MAILTTTDALPRGFIKIICDDKLILTICQDFFSRLFVFCGKLFENCREIWHFICLF